MRVVSTRVLPEPAPAIMSEGDWYDSTAARCAGFNPFKISSFVIVATKIENKLVIVNRYSTIYLCSFSTLFTIFALTNRNEG